MRDVAEGICKALYGTFRFHAVNPILLLVLYSRVPNRYDETYRRRNDFYFYDVYVHTMVCNWCIIFGGLIKCWASHNQMISQNLSYKLLPHNVSWKKSYATLTSPIYRSPQLWPFASFSLCRVSIHRQQPSHTPWNKPYKDYALITKHPVDIYMMRNYLAQMLAK